MKNIMICMELGDDLGHLTSVHPLVTELCARGFSLYCITKNLQNTRYFNWPEKVYFLQAPLYQSISPPHITYGFADILLYKGYQSVDEIKSLAAGWQHLHELIKPLCIIFDHSPTALLVFRSYSLPKYIFSNGFITLPVNDPELNLRSGNSLLEDKLPNRSKQVIQVVNEYLTCNNEDPISNLGELYQTKLTAIVGQRTTDIYRQYRDNEVYLSLPDVDFGFYNHPAIEENNKLNVFAYLKQKGSHSDLTIKTLNHLQISGVCYYAGISEDDAKMLSTDKLLITHKPIAIHEIIKKVRSVICHAGRGLVNTTIRHGLPMILLPTQLEQRWTTKVLEKRQCAVGIYRETSEAVAIQKIEHFFSSTLYRDQAKALEDELKQQTSVLDIQDFVNRIIEDLGG
jgi:UDP-N-acetylglucosamine transferase subunit ALG13